MAALLSDRAGSYHAAVRIITLNVNGIRSAAKKGAFDWLAKQDADVVCLQETKAQEHQLAGLGCELPGYHCSFFDAERPGYAGVALLSKRKPDRIVKGFKVPEFDAEGRYIEARYGDLAVVSLYLPSGSAGEHRQASRHDRCTFLDVPLQMQGAIISRPSSRSRQMRQFMTRAPP
jgi:exodeoxyribonuclease-3